MAGCGALKSSGATENHFESDLVAYRDEIAAMVCADQSDSLMENFVLRKLLTRIDTITSLSSDVPSVASSVLGCLENAYTYAYKTTQARLALEETNMAALSEFDAAFKKCLKSWLKEEELTCEEMDRCEQLAEEAMLDAKIECAKLLKIERKNSLFTTLHELEQIESETKTILLEEEKSLNGDKEMYSNEAKGIDDLLVQMKNVSDHCDEEYKKTVKQLEDEDIENRFHQENLDKELVRLERERELEAAVEEEKQKHQEQIIEKLEVLQNRLQKVVSTLTVEEYHQRDGNQFYDELVDKYSQRRDELTKLIDQTNMDLQVVEIMNECVEFVMCDAKEKNATWEKIKLTNLLQLRDTHMTVAFLHIIRADSCQAPAKSAVHQRVQECVREMQDELEIIDREIKTLRPQLHLDTLSERIDKQKRRSKRALQRRVKFVEVTQDSSENLDHNGRSLGLRNKRRRETDNKPSKRLRIMYSCEFCKMTFVYKCRLNQHLLSHTGEKPHKCAECSREFQLKGDLNRHMVKNHSDKKPFKCTECPKTYAKIGFLQRHLVIQHSIRMLK